MKNICVVFPGQGAQFVGMGRDLIQSDDSSVKEKLDQASDILGWDLKDLCLKGPEDKLRQTQYSQPALLIVSYILYGYLKKYLDIEKMVACAGLSLGEYTALLVAKSISFEQAVFLVKNRGLLMQKASESHPGVMASVIGIKEEVLSQIINKMDKTGRGPCVMANFNSPGQIVISGTQEAVSHVMEEAKKEGAKKTISLTVGGAFHSPLMLEAVQDFSLIVEKVELKEPRIPFYSNVTASAQTSPEEIKHLLCLQIQSPVRWSQLVQNIIKDKAPEIFLEIGPGKVLTGLLRRISKKDQGISMQDELDVDEVLKKVSQE